MRASICLLVIAGIAVAHVPATVKSIKMDQEVVAAIGQQYDQQKGRAVVDEYLKTLAATGDRQALSQIAHAACLSAETWQMGKRLLESLAAYPAEFPERRSLADQKCEISAKKQLTAAASPSRSWGPGGVNGKKYDFVTQQLTIPGFSGIDITPDEWRAIEPGTLLLQPRALDLQPIKPLKPLPSDLVIDKKIGR